MGPPRRPWHSDERALLGRSDDQSAVKRRIATKRAASRRIMFIGTTFASRRRRWTRMARSCRMTSPLAASGVRTAAIPVSQGRMSPDGAEDLDDSD
jgi:hypothetical protein